MRVLNKYHYPNGLPIGSIYIGRGSPFGNPFQIGKDGDRTTVLNKFKTYLYTNHQLRQLVLATLPGNDLVCFCAPKPCHGDIYINFINSYAHHLLRIDHEF